MSKPIVQQSVSGRLESLDGLRGLAAVLVLTFHSTLVQPELAGLVRDSRPVGGWQALSYTPLRLLWAGEESVLVFFVLSGLVLTLPFLHRPFRAVAYYPRRLLRIYLPVWASIALALAWTIVVPRTFSPDASWWVNGHAFDLSLRGLGGDATLVIGTTWLNSVLWSLKWEMWFSLLLPFYLLVFVRWRGWALPKFGALLAAVQVGSVTHNDMLRYLPIFAIGMMLAVHLPEIRGFVQSLAAWNWLLVLLALVLVLESRWVLGSFISAPTVLGAAILVAMFAVWAPAMAIGTWPPVAWLGTVSFSLYLVHEPIVTSVALLTRTTNPFVVLLVAGPVALLAAALFHRLVERPAHEFARWAGNWFVYVFSLTASWLQSRVRRRRAGTPA